MVEFEVNCSAAGPSLAPPPERVASDYVTRTDRVSFDPLHLRMSVFHPVMFKNGRERCSLGGRDVMRYMLVNIDGARSILVNVLGMFSAIVNGRSRLDLEFDRRRRSIFNIQC